MEILKAFLFGFSLAISVGPIAILIVNQSISFGLTYGMKYGVGAALADYVYAFIAFLGGNLIFHFLQDFKSEIGMVSSLILMLFGVWMIYQTWKKKNSENGQTHRLTFLQEKPLLTTFGLTILNPLTIIVFAGLAGQYQGLSVTQLLLMSTAIFAGSLVVQLFLALFGSRLARLLKNSKVLVYLNLISAILIMGFGFSKFI